MLKELEALNWVRQYEYINPKLKKRLDIIKTALKDYELMKQTKIIVVDKKISDDDLEKLKNQRVFVGNYQQCEIKPLYDEETRNKLKALEIIKECNASFNLCYIKETNEYRFLGEKITQEKYHLLRKVLL